MSQEKQPEFVETLLSGSQNSAMKMQMSALNQDSLPGAVLAGLGELNEDVECQNIGTVSCQVSERDSAFWKTELRSLALNT